MKKKRLLSAVFVFLVLLSFFASHVSALKAVGLVWKSESQVVEEDSTYCATYGAYNPLDDDVTVKLSIEGELADVVDVKENEPVTVKAGTTHTDPVELDICFSIPSVYHKDCLAGILCKQECSEGVISYRGDVTLAEDNVGSSKASGSKVSIGVSAPLELKVRCDPSDRNWMPVFIFIVALFILIAFFILLRTLRRRHAPKEGTSTIP